MNEFEPLLPDDEHNRKLVGHVHPSDWTNPQPDRPYHLVVIGAGTAGLVTAAAAAGLGARVALIERQLMGGDCLNVGCVPSKAIIRSARLAADLRSASDFGITLTQLPFVDFPAVMERMRRLRAEISPHDSAARFQELGVDVFFGSASFADGDRVSVDSPHGSRTLEYRKAVVATGARAAAPPIPGLDSVHYLTNETVFSLTGLPRRLGVIGSGPVGCEMAQALSQLGSEVVLFDRGDRILSKEDPEAAQVVAEQFSRDGIQLVLNSKLLKISETSEGFSITYSQGNEEHELLVDQLLVAAGRAPNVDELNLESVGVDYDSNGISVNDHLQTSNPRIFAAGDVCSRYKFTHLADFQARIVLQNALFSIGPFGRKKMSQLVIPWCTYTSPEVAHVGLFEHEAARRGIQVDVYKQDLAGVDRAILEGETQGFVKILTKRDSDRIVGATIVAAHAGEMISEITVAMNGGIGLSKIAGAIHPYPTQAEAIRKIGDQYNRTRLTPFSQRLLNLLRRINVGR
ncbi:mercuric reductase [Rubinisphaera margarita]|uniref:mercuric reductase n=1 Tax=Rubinisphaera margarita TaxID=2909586 RepID=UPI001EE93D70|nr:mercuric reductase [Rubinisphaera margarita]MCG6155924.1 mercuric reductase [Rubinisphaera margarita]